MTYSDFVRAVNTLWWGEHPPLVAPRHVLALYVGAYHAGMAAEQFMTFVGARNFVATVTAGLKEDKVAFETGGELLKLWSAGVAPKDALKQAFHPGEVKPEHLPPA